MVERETAKVLKGAGLRWIPQRGDYIQMDDHKPVIIDGIMDLPKPQIEALVESDYVWLPRLDQILQEVEQRANRWHMYSCDDQQNYKMFINSGVAFNAKTPEEAAAKALLWILGEGE